MRKVLLIGLCLFSMSVHGNKESENLEFLGEILVVSKFTGLCGAIHQMIGFQETTKMPGGDEFVVRFVAVETARLGMSAQEFMDQCATSINRYKQYAGIVGLE